MKQRSYLLLLLLIISLSVSAQNEDQFLPSELKQLTAVTEPATLRRGFFRVGVLWDYTSFKTVFDESAKRFFVPGSSIGRAETFDFSFQYGITDWLQLNIVLPYRMDKVESTQIYDDPLFRSILLDNYSVLQVNYAQYGYGIGDAATGLYAQIIKESTYIPSITFRTTAILPTGRKNPGNFSSDSLIFNSATGSGEFTLAVDLLAKKIVYPYSFTFYTGIDYGFGGEKVINPGELPSQFKSGTVFYAAGGVNFHLNDWICMTNEVYYTRIGREEINGLLDDQTKWRVMFMPYIHFQVKQLRLVQGIIIPVAGKLIPADPTFQLIVQYIF